MADDLGPLPKADANAVLQRKSLNKLAQVLSPDRFVLRDERTEDYGVDLSLEVLFQGRASNCRAQVQVKARTGLELNADGAYSVPVNVSNLNYLLNGPCPVYVLYRPEDDELYIAYAIDEHRRIERQGPALSAGGSITIKFRLRLNEQEIDALAARVITEAQRHRILRHKLAMLPPAGRARFELDETDDPGKVTSSEQAESLLLQSGMALVVRGFDARVIEMSRLLTVEQLRKHPKLHLVVGYAHFWAGSYLDSDACVRKALLVKNTLQAGDVRLLEYLIDTCELVFGNISADQYRERLGRWQKGASPEQGLQYEVLTLWQQMLGAEPSNQGSARNDLVRVLKEIQTLPEPHESLLRQAELLLLFLDIQQRTENLAQAVVAAANPGVWRQVYDRQPADVLNEGMRHLQEWQVQIKNKLHAIGQSGNVPMYCLALFTRDIGDMTAASQLSLASRITGLAISLNMGALCEQIRASQKIFTRFGQQELELRSRLLEADALALADAEDEAVSLANDVQAAAAALRQEDIRYQARRFVSDRPWQRLKEELSIAKSAGPEVLLAQLKDEDVERMAKETLDMLQLPPERLDIVRASVLAARDVGQTKLVWCRHFGTQESRTTPSTRENMFTVLLPQRATCNLHGLITAPFPSHALAKAALQAGNCRTCRDRAPLNEPSAAES